MPLTAEEQKRAEKLLKQRLANLDSSAGGFARAKAMTAQERSENARLAARVRWSRWQEQARAAEQAVGDDARIDVA